MVLLREKDYLKLPNEIYMLASSSFFSKVCFSVFQKSTSPPYPLILSSIFLSLCYNPLIIYNLLFSLPIQHKPDVSNYLSHITHYTGSAHAVKLNNYYPQVFLWTLLLHCRDVYNSKVFIGVTVV
jgi:hypothetical protein